MFLGEGKQAHDDQSRQDKSGYEVLRHGYHSTGLVHYVVGDRAAKDDEHRGRSRQRAARPTTRNEADYLPALQGGGQWRGTTIRNWYCGTLDLSGTAVPPEQKGEHPL